MGAQPLHSATCGCCLLSAACFLLPAFCCLLSAALHMPGALPPEIGLMHNLTDLLLANNKLTGGQRNCFFKPCSNKDHYSVF
jgi:hypothetical protein